MLSKNSLEKLLLREGRIRCHSMVHNGGWYNTLGEKIGWGDLDKGDMENIQKNLDEGEILVVLAERDSYWNFVAWSLTPQEIAENKKNNRTEQKPGQDYLIEHAYYVITNQRIYYNNRYGESELSPIALANLIKGGK